MPKTKKQPLVKSTAVNKTIASTKENLAAMMASTEKAVMLRSAESKKNLAASKRLVKKGQTLARKKKAAVNRLKKSPDAASRKALRDIEREIVANRREKASLKKVKDANSQELKALKASHKTLKAYTRMIAAADKALSKPRKKSRKKRA